MSCTTAGICTYTPVAGYVGPDSFDYTVTDGNGGFDIGTVSVTVFQPNRPPVGNADSYTTQQDALLTVPAATGVLANDTDADGNTLTAAKVGDPSHGAVVLNADGSFVYTPVAGYHGPDSFTYQVSDGTVSVGPITVSIEVIPPPAGPADPGQEPRQHRRRDGPGDRLDPLGQRSDADLGPHRRAVGDGRPGHRRDVQPGRDRPRRV